MRLQKRLHDFPYESNRKYCDALMYELEKEKENQIKVHLKKREFMKLKIIGQFNKGFIVCTLNKQDLFIIDQHACNERYNLERFTTLLKIDSQPLMKPIVTEIARDSLQLIRKYERIFSAYGFKYEEVPHTQYQDPSTTLIKIKSLPESNDNIYEASDFLNLVTAVRNYDHQKDPSSNPTHQQLFEYLMPKKIQAVVALKACRSAIMIGDVLTRGKMREHVDRMKSLREPWFCAHGRPTTVFIMNFDKLKAQKNHKFKCRMAK